MKLISTAAAGRALGVGPTTIKRWSDEGRLRCVRTAGGHRRFAQEEVERFRNELALFGEVPEGVRWVQRISEISDEYRLQAALLEERSRLGNWWSVAEFLGDALTELGNRWACDDASIADEHMLTNRLARALSACAAAESSRGELKMLLATAEGDRHTVALSLAELCAREAGWSCEWLGEPTSNAELVRKIPQLSITAVAVSASPWSGERHSLQLQYDRLADVCRAHGIALIIGGNGAWPEYTPYGYRVRSFARLSQLLAQLQSPPPRRGSEINPETVCPDT